MKYMAAFTMVNIIFTVTHIYASLLYNKIPYHTSALTGTDWVCELLDSHPEQIHNELGVHKHGFYVLIDELQLTGHEPSKHVYLEEQMAIFLYTCITGLMFVNGFNVQVIQYQCKSPYIDSTQIN